MVQVSFIGFGRKYELVVRGLQTGLTLYTSPCIKQGLPYEMPQVPKVSFKVRLATINDRLKHVLLIEFSKGLWGFITWRGTKEHILNIRLIFLILEYLLEMKNPYHPTWIVKNQYYDGSSTNVHLAIHYLSTMY